MVITTIAVEIQGTAGEAIGFLATAKVTVITANNLIPRS